MANIPTVKYNIITEDFDPLLAGCYVGDKGYLVNKDDDKWIQDLNRIIKDENVDLIIPCHDIPLDILANRGKEVNAPILMAKSEAVKAARDKLELNRLLVKYSMKAPVTEGGLSTKVPYPVIVKPRMGFGSKDQTIIKDNSQMEALKTLFRTQGKKDTDFITQELLFGRELSGMILIGKAGNILSTTCAESVKKFGMSYKTIMGNEADYALFKSEAVAAAYFMDLIGPISVQAILGTNGVFIFEINPRFTGAQVIRATAGVNGPDILIRNWLDGENDYQKVNKRLVAFWTADYLYASEQDVDKLRSDKVTTRKAQREDLL
jgi:carbamoylphosphate synthase large subunit